jgi:hypothetical protein
MKNLFRGLFLACALTAASASASPVKILNFAFGAIGFFPTGGSNTWFAQAAWTPTVDLGFFGIRGEAGFTAPKNALGDRFVATNFELLGQLLMLPKITVEAGGGMHNWMGGNGGTNAALSAGISIGLAAGLDRVYATYSRVFLGSGVNEFKIGLGIDL